MGLCSVCYGFHIHSIPYPVSLVPTQMTRLGDWPGPWLTTHEQQRVVMSPIDRTQQQPPRELGCRSPPCQVNFNKNYLSLAAKSKIAQTPTKYFAGAVILFHFCLVDYEWFGKAKEPGSQGTPEKNGISDCTKNLATFAGNDAIKRKFHIRIRTLPLG